MLPPPQYGSVNVTTLAVGIGDSVEYTCDSGYELEGTSILTCQEQDNDTGGQWNTMAPQCNTGNSASISTDAIVIALVAVLTIIAILLLLASSTATGMSHT